MGDKPGYVIGGDALRGVMMCAVMLVHAAGGLLFAIGPISADAKSLASAYDPFGELIFSLDIAIWTFFALSGYLVGGPYVRAFVEGTRWPHPGRYLSRRARRILPAFWLWIVVLYLVFGSYGATREQMLQTVFFLQAVDPTPFEQVFVQGWTVGVEVCFYLSLPVVAWVLARWGAGRGTRESRRAWLVGALLVLAAASIALRAGADPIGTVARTIVGSAWGFVPGLLLAAYEPDFRARLAGTARGKAIGAGSLAICVIAFVVYWQTFSRPGSWAGELLTVVIATSFLTALLTCQWAWGRMPRVLDSRPIHALGRWSFGFYLVHVAIIRELLVRLPDGMSNLGALAYVSSMTLVIGLSLAALSWWLLEEPFIERRRPRRPRWMAKDTTKPPQPPLEDPAIAAKVPA